MAKRKKRRGHYCYVCASVLPNEKFSGKGHRSNICKMCAKLPSKEKQEKADLNKISRLYRYSNLSKVNRLMLEAYLASGSEYVREMAQETLDYFSDIRCFDEEYSTDYFEQTYGDWDVTECYTDHIDMDNIPF